MCRVPSASAIRQPSPPKVSTTRAAPRARRRATVASGVAVGVASSTAASSRLTNRRSMPVRSAGRRAALGAETVLTARRQLAVRARSTKAASTSAGRLQSAKTKAAAARCGQTRSNCARPNWSKMAMSAMPRARSLSWSSTATYSAVARLVEVATWEVSTPSSRSWRRISRPFSSSPTRETKLAVTPRRARFSTTLRATPPKLRLPRAGLEVPGTSLASAWYLRSIAAAPRQTMRLGCGRT